MLPCNYASHEILNGYSQLKILIFEILVNNTLSSMQSTKGKKGNNFLSRQNLNQLLRKKPPRSLPLLGQESHQRKKKPRLRQQEGKDHLLQRKQNKSVEKNGQVYIPHYTKLITESSAYTIVFSFINGNKFDYRLQLNTHCYDFKRRSLKIKI